jgi:hypothetical protein
VAVTGFLIAVIASLMILLEYQKAKTNRDNRDKELWQCKTRLNLRAAAFGIFLDGK